MAMRILQFGLVFAIGLRLGLAQGISGAGDAGVKAIPLSVTLIDPQDVTVARRQPATLRCDYNVHDDRNGDQVKVTWYHNNRTVDSKDQRRVLKSDGSLFIPKVTAGKKQASGGLTGEYKCQISTKDGSLISSSAKLQVADLDKEFSRYPENQTVVSGQSAVIHCQIHSFPAATIQWERNDLPLPHSTKYVPLPSGSLLITETNSSDAGSYRCIVTNTILNKTVSSNTGELLVASPSGHPEAPTFLPLNVPMNTTALLNEDVKLYCAATGWPLPRITWLYNGRYILGNSSILHLSNVDITATGSYSCVAGNHLSHINQSHNVEVYQKPHFNITPTSKTYLSSITVRFDCHVLGVPQPTVYWLKDSEPLPIGGRIKRQLNGHGVILSHTFSFDSGFYQCVAENSAGRIWSAAQLVLMQRITTGPPEHLECRPYDDSSICLTWRAPPNVTPQAYSVYSFYTPRRSRTRGENSESEVAGPEYLFNETHMLANSLDRNTSYTFYVRLYLRKEASDPSNTITCQTGVQGSRDLHIETLNNNSVKLTWSKMSTDTTCNGVQGLYRVQWRRQGLLPYSAEETANYSYVISGLKPKMRYEFSVISMAYLDDEPIWVPFLVTDIDNSAHRDADEFNSTDIIPIAPEQLEANALSANIVNLSWTDQNANIESYTICYVKVEDKLSCEDGQIFKSLKNVVEITRLNPNTLYEFRVRSHISENVYGPFSQPLEIRTPLDVPSPILNLNYTIINETTICLHWEAPQFSQARVTKYLVSYTPDKNWPLEQWICLSVLALDAETKGCWPNGGNTLSTFVSNLKVEENYTLFVRGVSEVGNGKPVKPIEISTNRAFGNALDNPASEPQVDYVHIVGLALGILLILSCILVFIFVRVVSIKRRRRRRGLEGHSGATTSHNYCPAVAHYATQSSSVQVRLEEPAEVHEIEHLVEEEAQTNIPPQPDQRHLDTKGAEGFPNGHINGASKPLINGYIPNGHVNITENPQYYAADYKNLNRPKNTVTNYEDTNSNVQTSKFRDLQKLFESSKKPSNYQHCSPRYEKSDAMNDDCSVYNSLYNLDISTEDSNMQDTLNSTQLTELNDSLLSRRRLSPILGPNG